jgi:5-methylthioadenosine/S-adenosylhomocysteine deaminase
MTLHAITGATVLQHDDAWTPAFNMDVVMSGDSIVAYGPGAAADYLEAETTDGHNLLLTPGLVNAHCHSAEALARGLATDSGLDKWLPALADVDALSSEDISLAVDLCAVEQLRSGVTSVVDHFRQLPATLDAGEAVSTAWEKTGLRAMVALMIRDRANPDGTAVGATHSGPPPLSSDLLDLSEAWLNGAPQTPGVVRGLGPSAVIRCTEALLAMLADLATRHGAPFHVHVDETADQAEQARHLFDGNSAIATLGTLGALGPRTSLVHCVHISGADIEMLSETGTTAVHCPVANQRLGSGIAPVSAMQRSGVSVNLATDGAASNDSQSMTEVVKAALLLNRTVPTGETWLTPVDVLDMVFRPGIRAFLGQDAPNSGMICVGAPADIAAFDLAEPTLMPANDLAAQFALAGGSLRARHVWVRGALRLANGNPVGIDLDRLADRVRARSQRLAKAA